MTAFVGFCIGVIVCITATILGEREYGRMMYRRGYSQALEDIRREKDCRIVEEHGMNGDDDWFYQGIARGIDIVKRGGCG